MTRTAVTTIGVKAILSIDGTNFDLTSFDVTYIANQVARAVCFISIGFKGYGQGVAAQGLSSSLVRGTPAQLILTVANDVTDPISDTPLLKSGTYIALDGLVEDVAPSNLSYGQFNFKVLIVSKLAILSSGTLQLNNLAPQSWFDTSVVMGYLNGPNGTSIAPTVPQFDGGAIGADFWAELARVFEAISATGLATGSSNVRSAVAQFAAAFGTDVNVNALAVLQNISGSLPLAPGVQTLGVGIASYLTNMFLGQYHMESFYARVITLSQEFRFRVFESFTGLHVVPYSPFYAASDAVSIYPSTYTAANWINREPNSVLGAAIMAAGASVTSTDPNIPYLVGSYKRPISQNPFGIILPVPSPPWILNYQNYNDNFVVSTPDVTTSQIIGDNLARDTALDFAYRGSAIQLLGPLRTDIGLFTPVQVLYPSIAGGITNGPSVYGSVQMVKLHMDSVTKTADTTMEVGYVRSAAMQSLEVDGYVHPIFASNYTGARLDQ